MEINKLKQSLKLHEGVRNLPYEDSEGILTIGVGHNLENPLSDRAIEIILEDDIQIVFAELDRALPGWKSHPENVQGVLADMVFNLGMPRFLSFKKMIKALDARDYNEAAAEMLDSKWADQVGVRAENLASKMWSV